jgi:hypothetical protein
MTHLLTWAIYRALLDFADFDVVLTYGMSDTLGAATAVLRWHDESLKLSASVLVQPESCDLRLPSDLELDG